MTKKLLVKRETKATLYSKINKVLDLAYFTLPFELYFSLVTTCEKYTKVKK